MDENVFLEKISEKGFSDIDLDTERLNDFFRNPAITGEYEYIGSFCDNDSALRVFLEWADDNVTPGLHFELLSPADKDDKYAEYLPSDKEHKHPYFYDGTYDFYNRYDCKNFEELVDCIDKVANTFRNHIGKESIEEKPAYRIPMDNFANNFRHADLPITMYYVEENHYDDIYSQDAAKDFMETLSNKLKKKDSAFSLEFDIEKNKVNLCSTSSGIEKYSSKLYDTLLTSYKEALQETTKDMQEKYSKYSIVAYDKDNDVYEVFEQGNNLDELKSKLSEYKELIDKDELRRDMGNGKTGEPYDWAFIEETATQKQIIGTWEIDAEKKQTKENSHPEVQAYKEYFNKLCPKDTPFKDIPAFDTKIAKEMQKANFSKERVASAIELGSPFAHVSENPKGYVQGVLAGKFKSAESYR